MTCFLFSLSWHSLLFSEGLRERSFCDSSFRPAPCLSTYTCMDCSSPLGSFSSSFKRAGFETFNYDEIRAAIDTTHQFGKRIAIHSYGPDGARDAVRAGTDTLKPATDMDDATIRDMVKRGTYYVPTIDHNRYYIDNRDKIGYAPGFKDRLQAFIQRNLETTRRAQRAGVKISMARTRSTRCSEKTPASLAGS
jgi:hypothetical protein